MKTHRCHECQELFSEYMADDSEFSADEMWWFKCPCCGEWTKETSDS